MIDQDTIIKEWPGSYLLIWERIYMEPMCNIKVTPFGYVDPYGVTKYRYQSSG
jgi:hypothetical protein